ncbi:putative transporter C1529,01 [Talaromyces islandicus]|uniref:Putative transporter C1529,01 n=1 Tax=Talaromyces islandicus TaxID=28573 RepID=A0A0U1M2S1_TALIS|nr:putative transporter C1529,01 [Talaromyces islandicus]
MMDTKEIPVAISDKEQDSLTTSTPPTRASYDATSPTNDEFEVDWDGPDDAADPRNWKTLMRLAQIIPSGVFSLNMTLAATMFAPGVEQVVQEFGITTSIVATMLLTIYVLGFGAGVVISPLSELYGRLWLYHVSNTAWLAFTLGCAFSTNTTSFLVFRFLSGCAGSVPMTCGGGTVADLVPPKDRGKYMAIWGLGPQLGPIVGPIVGGFMSQTVGWRWTFRLLAALGGASLLVGVIVLRETSEATLLKRKAARLRKINSNNAYAVVSRVNKTGNLSSSRFLIRALVRPTKLLMFSPIVLTASLYNAFIFGLMFMLFDTFPQVFHSQYGFSPGVQGLVYVAFGVGTLLGMAVLSKFSDKHMNHAAAGAQPEGRLKLTLWFSPTVPIGFLWYGWSAEKQTHWIVPILGTLIIGFGSLFVMMITQIYLVDVFGAAAAASALSAVLITRTIAGAFLPLCGAPLYTRLGYGWGNSLLALILLVLYPIPIMIYRYGKSLRERFPVRL